MLRKYKDLRGTSKALTAKYAKGAKEINPKSATQAPQGGNRQGHIAAATLETDHDV
jgi:hypothetical protein